MSCIHKKWHDGVRTYGANVPGYAQGAYFPGDEPGYTCKKAGGDCGDPDSDTPECCDIQENTGWLCPECAEAGRVMPLRRNGRGIVNCVYGHSFGKCTEAPEIEEVEG